MQQMPVTACEHCGQPIAYGQLVCPRCGGLVHRRQLEQLAGDAMRLEPINPPAAGMVWREALDLLPRDSQQYAELYRRIGALASGWSPAVTPGQGPGGNGAPPTPLGYAPRPARPSDQWGPAIAKTVGSMLLSIAVYYALLFQNLPIAVGFVVLMLIHELGHVLAMRYYRISASPPIFIPFLGAVINMRQQPPNALVESIVGIGGPLLGTAGALGCYALALSVGEPLRNELIDVAQLAFMLNLFNLLPVPPLDGGRITAAISPWIWIAGLGGLAYLIIEEVRSGSQFGLVIPGLILLYAIPRIRMTLRARGMKIPYYNVSRAASWTMAALYVGLGAVLWIMFQHLGGLQRFRV